MSDTPRYSTLRDYLRVISKQRWLILGVAALFAAAAFGVSSLQTPKYTSETSLSFREIGQDQSFLGNDTLPELAPDQRANINAERVQREDIAKRVQKALNTDLTVEEVQNSVTTEVGTKTSFVIIQATDESPEFATRLANEYAVQIQTLDTAQVRDRIDQAIESLRDGLKAGSGGDAGSQAFAGAVTRQQISQLETLREFAEPVQIATRAEVPDSPSSPRTMRNTVLGLIVGLTFGLAAAFLRDTLDRRLRQSDDVQNELHLPVVGRVPEEALGEPGFADNGRPHDDEVEAHLEGFRMLRTNLEFLKADSEMRTVLVTSGLPEEGKSSVAIGLAGAAAIAGKRTLLVECDLRRPCFAERLGIERTPGLSDYLVGRADPQDVLQVVQLIEPLSSNGTAGQEKVGDLPDGAWMACITSGSPAPLPAELLGSERFEHFLEKVSKAYDLVVLDTSPILPVVDALELVPYVDGMLVCVRLSRTTREEARAASEALRHMPQKPTGVVVTGVRPGEDSYGYYYGAYSADL